MERTELERYEVTFLDVHTGNKWSAFYMAESYGHAEEQACDGAGAEPDPIIMITKDYNVER